MAETILTGLLKRATLEGRTAEKTDSYGKDDERGFRGKIEILADEIIGLMLVSAEIWKKAAKTKKDEITALKDSLLNFMLEKGREAGFSFDNLIKLLKTDKEKNRAENLYFKKKYRLDLNNNLEEIIIADQDRELDEIIVEIKRELKKEKLQKITHDLKVAEEKKDQEAIKFLRSEFNKICQDLV